MQQDFSSLLHVRPRSRTVSIISHTAFRPCKGPNSLLPNASRTPQESRSAQCCYHLQTAIRHCYLQNDDLSHYYTRLKGHLWLCLTIAIVEARDVFLSAVVPPVSALSSLRYADFWALYSTGRVPLPVLVKYVAICVRVGRQCHQWWTCQTSCFRKISI